MKLDRNDMLEFMKLFAFVLFVLVIVLVLIGLPIYVGYRQGCKQFAEFNPELDVRWGLWTGCLVRTPQGIYVPKDDYSYIFGNMDVQVRD